METTDLSAMTNSELDERIGAAALDADAKRLQAFESERDRRRNATERQALADRERARRAHADNEAERDALLAKLTQQLTDLEQRHRDDLADLERTPHADAYPVVERAYQSGRAAYSLAHDLCGVSADRRFYRPYRVPDALALHGGRVGEQFLLSIRGCALVVETPWSDDLARLRALMPRAHAIGNGG